MDAQSTITIGVLLLALITVESGGLFMKRIVQGNVPANDLQRSFNRAGHAHAAVLIILSIVITIVLPVAHLTGILEIVARLGVPAAAILMPAGFFLSVLGRDPQKPSRLVALLWAGVVCLTAGLLTSGLAILIGGINLAHHGG
ncbi:MAG TPA: hypothetical protein VHX87_00215 [Galbitalea sp.]|jgi:hypothetical protein|nr:hypothetical protein [Galbitalea sp.]